MPNRRGKTNEKEKKKIKNINTFWWEERPLGNLVLLFGYHKIPYSLIKTYWSMVLVGMLLFFRLSIWTYWIRRFVTVWNVIAFCTLYIIHIHTKCSKWQTHCVCVRQHNKLNILSKLFAVFVLFVFFFSRFSFVLFMHTCLCVCVCVNDNAFDFTKYRIHHLLENYTDSTISMWKNLMDGSISQKPWIKKQNNFIFFYIYNYRYGNSIIMKNILQLFSSWIDYCLWIRFHRS